MPGHAIPGLMPMYPLLGDVSFPRLGKSPSPKSFPPPRDGCMLTKNVVSYALNQWCPKTLSKCLHCVNIGTVCVTDARSKLQFRVLQNSSPTISP
ncbi:hypothetical protein NPIL_681721 [Nephila pilipes]|uniref:Uncharacterized protein n=1 Tax=Nephila pilipes TaxID=299642 RepID=A0A8X6U8P1_NEPPI|nr:hypothetical protein NPIL_681721 [Nephila pilipes]